MFFSDWLFCSRSSIFGLSRFFICLSLHPEEMKANKISRKDKVTRVGNKKRRNDKEKGNIKEKENGVELSSEINIFPFPCFTVV